MTPSKIPHLCGGILYDLLLEARKPRQKARNKFNGGSDGLSAPDIYAGLIHVVTGEDMSNVAGSTLEKCASDYKKCVSSTGTYVPFTNPATISAFDSAIKRKSPDLLERMSGFVNKYLNVEKCEWLVRAIIQTIQEDEIDDSTLFAVSYNGSVKAEDLHVQTKVVLQPFLLSVLHYVLLHCPDCESGRPTFEAWYSQATKKSEWKFDSDIGCKINPISVSTELPDTSPYSDFISDDTFEDTDSDDKVITESLSRTAALMAGVLKAQKHQLAEEIRRNSKKSSQTESDASYTTEGTAEEEDLKKGNVIHQQTNVIQNGDNNVNVTNNGTINFNF